MRREYKREQEDLFQMLQDLQDAQEQTRAEATAGAAAQAGRRVANVA
jgi:hypothetical protein